MHARTWILGAALVVTLGATRDASAEIKDRPFFTGEATLDVITPGNFGAQGRLDITIADPVWFTARGRTNYLLFKELSQVDRMDTFDLLVGFDVHKYFGPGTLSFITYAGYKSDGPQGAGDYGDLHTIATGVRTNWVVAMGLKGTRLATSDPPKGDGKLHFGHAFMAGLQYHAADDEHSHRTTEVYVIHDTEGHSTGGEVLWHFGLGRAVGGMDIGILPRFDGGHQFMWAILELGISFEL